ncbi:MAG: AAA family ATPase, partial [Candidatus Brocadiales bacterium]
SPKDILGIRHYVAMRTPLRDESPIVRYSTRVVRATRPEEATDGFIRGLVLYGASPRASISLAKAARAYSFIKGDDAVLPEHVQAMAYPVLRHRIILTHEAESRGVDADEVIRDVLERVPRFE